MIFFLQHFRKQKHHSKMVKGGFSIIQVVVAIVIFGMTLSATVSLVGTVIKQVAVNKQRITAIYLAQECLELARNVRDSSWEQNYPWNCAFQDDSGSYSDKYTIEPTDIVIRENPQNIDCQRDFGVKIKPNEDGQLYILGDAQTLGYRYTHEGGDNENAKKTRYKRLLTLTDIKSDQVTVNCQVQWGNDDEVINISEILSNWRKKG